MLTDSNSPLALCLQKAERYSAWVGSNPRLEADIMRCMAGSSHIVQMQMASFAYQDGEEHSYIVLEWVLQGLPCGVWSAATSAAS